MPIEWREQMSVDGGVIDQDHRHLIDIINRFEILSADGLTDDECLEILFALKFYAATHFAREEQLQRLIDYPFSEAHKHEHRRLEAELDNILGRVRTHQEGGPEEDAAEIATMLHHWFVDHTLKSDLKMREYVEGLREHGEHLGALKDIEHPAV